MKTHHKILWSMALLACGSFLTPVKVSLANNLTQSVEAVRGKVGASATDIASTIEAQKEKLHAGAANLTVAVQDVEGRVGAITTDINSTIEAQKETLYTGASTLTVAVEDVVEAVGGQIENGVYTNVTTSTEALQSGVTDLVTAVTNLQGLVAGTGVVYFEVSEALKLIGGTDLASALQSLLTLVGYQEGITSIDKITSLKAELAQQQETT